MHVQTTDGHRVAVCIKKSYDGGVYQTTNHLAYVIITDPHKTPTKLFSPCFWSFLAPFRSLGVASSYLWILCDSIPALIIYICKDLWKMNKNIQISDRLPDLGAIMSLTDTCGAAVADYKLYPPQISTVQRKYPQCNAFPASCPIWSVFCTKII